jgi:hypothetical protein
LSSTTAAAYPPDVVGHPPGSSLWLAACALLLAACSETVALGSECPAFGLECLDDGQDGTDGDGSLDDGDADDPDAAVPMDAGQPDAGDDGGLGPAYPALENGSFDITSEPPAPGEVTPISDTAIDPWTWCGGTIVVGPELSGYAPTEGDTLMSMAFGAGPGRLGQELATPLEVGRTYALALDVARSESGGDLRLQLVGTNDDCAGSDTLAQTEPLAFDQAAGLVKHCLVFTPTEDYSHIVLTIGSFTLIGTVFVDNLRFDASCVP